MKLVKTVVLCGLFLTNQAIGFGGVVTDPGSYTYYGTQIEKAVKQIETLEKQYKQATQTYTKITSIDDNITGNIQRALNQLKKIKAMQDISLANGKKSLLFTKKALNEITDIPSVGEDISDNIDKTFGLEQQKRNDWISVEAEKKATKQKALKQAVIDAEVAQGKVDLQLKQIEDLASMTNSSDSIKDATDINNTILLQMAEQQQEMILLLSNISKNIALANYDGKDESNPELGYSNGKRNGKSMTDKSDWSVKSKNKPKSMTSCDPFAETCKYSSDNPFKDAFN